MLVPPTKAPGKAAWSIDDIAYDSIALDRIRHDRHLFQLVTSASFVEITSDLYTGNLAVFFATDPAVVRWLREEWEPEELQHGAALRRYVETVWPDFDWAAAYEGFLREYTPYCQLTRFAASQSLELAGRCVVETGTASFYRMLAENSPEPILQEIASNIAQDEVRHYKNFYQYFREYAKTEHPTSLDILSTLWSRVTEINSHDAYFAFKHTYLGSGAPDGKFDDTEYGRFREGVRRIARRHFPHEMAIKMWLKPLGLGRRTSQIVVPAVTFATRHFLIH